MTDPCSFHPLVLLAATQFGWLEQKDLQSVHLVSKKWHDVLQSLLESFVLSKYDGVQELEGVFTRFPSLPHRREFSTGRFFIHRALEYVARHPEIDGAFDTIQCIWNHSDPDVVYEKDNDGWTPLYTYVAHGGGDPEVVRFLLEVGRDAMYFFTNNGRLPLENAFAFPVSPIQVIEQLVDRNVLLVPYQSGLLPIHSAVRYGLATDVLDLLREKDNSTHQLFSSMDRHGFTPLHYIWLSETGAEATIEWFKEKSPQSFVATGHWDYTPLHVGVCVDPRPELLSRFRAFVSAYRAALWARTDSGNLPLHTSLVCTSPWIELIKFLLDQFPEAATIANDSGELPIHISCANATATTSVLDTLISANPQGLFAYDNQGRLPFHRRCEVAKDIATIESLIAANLPDPSPPTTRDGTSALFHACEQNAELTVINFLVREHSKDLFLNRTNNEGDDASSDAV